MQYYQRIPQARTTDIESTPYEASRQRVLQSQIKPKDLGTQNPIFCPYCGFAMGKDSSFRFCPSCGEKIP